MTSPNASRRRLLAVLDVRRARFVDRVGSAIPVVGAWRELRALADEQAALRRVAELVAGGVPPQEVLDAVVAEASRLLDHGATALMRYDPDGSATIVAVCRSPAPLGLRLPFDPDTGIGRVLRTGRTDRTDSFENTGLADVARELGVKAGVAVPITVEGRVWGNLSTSSPDLPIPSGAEERLSKFAELVALAIAGAHARSALRAMVDEQAALRRVAELVARGVGQEELFSSVATEASRLIQDEATTLLRFDDHGAAVVAACGGPAPIGTRIPISPADDSTPARVLRTGRLARVDDYSAVEGPGYARRFGIGSSVGAPIVVEDRVWGMLGVTTPDRRLPAGAELRLQQFAELVAAALANAQARAELQHLADEQAALRRVAELVARGVQPDEVFAAVAAEASALMDDVAMTLTRFEESDALVVVALSGGPTPLGTRIAYQTATLPDRVRRTARTTRIDDYADELDAALAAQYGLAAAVAAPIIVEARVWGMLTATAPDRPLPAGTEHRLAEFAGLVGTAVANAESRAQLTASRARIVAAADESRRRVQRDVHDGAQQRLVQTVISLKLAREALAGSEGPALELVDEGLLHAERATAELRDLVRGILPASLSRGGLRAGIESLLNDLPLPAEVRMTAPRLPAGLETTAYFVVAEALTNVVKHARATQAQVAVAVEDGRLVIEVRDDGTGGADPRQGTGLTGLFDRVEATEGTLAVVSARGQGTTVRASLPLDDAGAT